MTKQIVWMGTAVMATLLALALLWQFRLVVVYVLFSLALAAAIRPLVKRLAGKSLAVRLTMILLSLLALGGFALLLVLSGGAVIHEIQQLTRQVSVQDTTTKTRENLQVGAALLQERRDEEVIGVVE